MKRFKTYNLHFISTLILLFLLLFQQYAHNMDPRNWMHGDFDGTSFDPTSAQFATGTMEAGENGLHLAHYGLSRVERLTVIDNDSGQWDDALASDKVYNDEYALPLVYNRYIETYAENGKMIVLQTKDGEVYRLQDSIINEENETCVLIFDKPCKELRSQEELDSCLVFNENGEQLPYAVAKPYRKQYGLQGKIYYHAARLFSAQAAFDFFTYATSFMTALVVMLICGVIYKKYSDIKLAAAFYIVFWLSPWVSAFAQHLYWVEFLWFIPMLLGLLYVAFPKLKYLWFALIFIAVTVKSLCGFEYISTVLMAMVMFPIAEFFEVKERRQKAVIFKDVAIMTVLSLAAFCVGFVVLANARGDGSIAEGIRIIIQDDAIRRTGLADPESFSGVLKSAAEAGLFEVLGGYLIFKTDIITFVPGILFPAVIVLALTGLTVAVIRKEKYSVSMLVVMIFSFFASNSWLTILARPHSYVHTHLNYVLWYFGFVQICIYGIIKLVCMMTAKFAKR
ncbi:MAG: hypothetical protein IJO54_02825 [Oscillospiraceae bacterium]|nr:hypothetical protein [Oscillospiraceae bacterium]